MTPLHSLDQYRVSIVLVLVFILGVSAFLVTLTFAQGVPLPPITGDGDGGGGKGYWLTLTPRPAVPPLESGRIRIRAFADYDGDGIFEPGERAGLGGLTVEVVGNDTAGNPVLQTGVLDAQGKFTASLLPGTYAVAAHPGDRLLGRIQTTLLRPVLLGPRAEVSIDIGFRPRYLRNYRPCLTVRSDAPAGSRTDSPAQQLLARLVARDGRRVAVYGEFPNSLLMSRREFVALVLRTQCVPDSSIDSSPAAARSLFRDAPADAERASLYRPFFVAWAAGLPVMKQSVRGPIADPFAPVNRAEALRILSAAFAGAAPPAGESPTAETASAASLLASDGQSPPTADPGIFPPNFQPIASVGLTPAEAAGLLVRAAFVGGRIDLASPSLPFALEPPAVPDYLRTLPSIERRACLQQDFRRTASLTYSDVTPDDEDLYWRLRLLTSLRTSPSPARWLLSPSPTETGIAAGEAPLKAGQQVTLLETVRALQILTCHPLESAEEAVRRHSGLTLSIAPAMDGGLAGYISPVRGDGGFSSRLLRGVLLPTREYNLSLLSFAGPPVRPHPLEPDTLLTAEDAAPLLASALLYTRVRTGHLLPDQAEDLAVDLRAAILRDLSDGRDVLSRPVRAAPVPFTRSMLVHFLSDALRQEYPAPLSPDDSVAGAWWEFVTAFAPSPLNSSSTDN